MPLQGPHHSIPRQPGEPKRNGRQGPTGFRDTYRLEQLIEDGVLMVKLHLPGIEEFQARELTEDMVRGVMESRYLVQR